MSQASTPVWSNPAAVAAHCDARIAEAEAQRASAKLATARTLESVLLPVNRMYAAIDKAYGIVGLLSNVHPSKDVREAAESCERKVQALISDVLLDRGLYDAIAGVDVSLLAAEDRRFVEKLLRDFRRSGVDKDEITRSRLKAMHAEMVAIGQDFSRNIREDVRRIEVSDKSELEGLPSDWLAARPPNAEGKVVISTDYPDYFPVMTYAKSERLRRELAKKFLDRGYPKNEEPLLKLLALRKEYSQRLGYENWAAYNAEDKMVKTSTGIAQFLEDITKFARPRAQSDVKELLARKKKDNPSATAVEEWDRFYYVENVREEKFGFDAQAVRPYFEFGRVTSGLFDVYGELFGVEFRRNDVAPRWHDGVIAYDVISKGEKIAFFYLDMHPREGKYKHAAMFPIETGLHGGQMPVAALVCNFSEPRKGQGPALMEHSDVVTYFHEFGHLIHHLLARKSRWMNLAGINVEWDFVEAPSQLLEEWAWDPLVLARFAKHVDTDAPIPADLVAKMRASSEFGKGAHVMRQLFLAALSYRLHVADPKDLDLLDFQKKLEREFMPYPHVEGTHYYAGFGHIEGYSSMYYTYQWSLVLAKDIFTKFSAEGLLNPAVARAYREKVLEPGGSKDAAMLVSDFLGRPSSLDAYRTWLERD